MAEEIGKIQKPQMRGLLHGQIKRNLVFVTISCFVAGCYMKFIFGNGRKAKHAEFYKTYDIDKEFDCMRRKGLFDSCDVGADESDDDKDKNNNNE